ncbi:helix-turn-helix domain-containing protein [Spiroplasma culicicola]|uniref:HTH marR-type domain-containing protein n=1 Tax=Spiroplasma culicicola AES-1 TaxID=1276246 RepID=W6AFC6_9MOLU|nr:MarR family transcriptional regulator [Spiroplasma culicicola]AHI52389.1 hypothetical protein SCULI_v1c00480 [Spiroplasma culicicola AES-1]
MKKNYNIVDLSFLLKNYVMIEFLIKDLNKKSKEVFNDLYDNAFIHLMFIKNVTGISQAELADLTNTNKSTLFRNINILSKANYIIKKTSSRANENEIYLSTKGEKAVDKIIEFIEEYEQLFNLDQNIKEKINLEILKVIFMYLPK